MKKETDTHLVTEAGCPRKPVCDDSPKVALKLSSRNDPTVESRRQVLLEVMGRTLTTVIAVADILSNTSAVDFLLKKKDRLNNYRMRRL